MADDRLDAPPAAEAPEEKQTDPSKRTPEAWREVVFPSGPRNAPHLEAWKHGAAAGLHGWELHKFHTGKDLLLSEEDYRAALKAASQMVPVEGAKNAFSYVPHEPALAAPLREARERRQREEG